MCDDDAAAAATGAGCIKEDENLIEENFHYMMRSENNRLSGCL